MVAAWKGAPEGDGDEEAGERVVGDQGEGGAAALVPTRHWRNRRPMLLRRV